MIAPPSPHVRACILPRSRHYHPTFVPALCHVRATMAPCSRQRNSAFAPPSRHVREIILPLKRHNCATIALLSRHSRTRFASTPPRCHQWLHHVDSHVMGIRWKFLCAYIQFNHMLSVFFKKARQLCSTKQQLKFTPCSFTYTNTHPNVYAKKRGGNRV